ncbi:6-phosphogluconolactonase [Zhongshania guokunii]|uniref:6-phosphogluconolactonase n=1 Tax=Zhongshania guokunii TaxID=641783 RepID=A0ABV3U2S9_9GAMM
MNNKPTLILLPNRDELNTVLSNDIGKYLNAVLSKHKAASLAVSGGSTPAEMLTLLGKQTLDWPKIQTLLVDDRWLGESHHDSNQAMLNKTLFSGLAANSRYLPLKNEAADVNDGQYACEEQLTELTWPLSVVHLGMGNDGHTASWFHDAPEYPMLMAAHEQHCTAVHPGAAPYSRISLTPAAVLNSERIVIQVFGKAKRDVLERALAKDADFPISMVLHQQRVPVDIYWAP